MLHASFLEQCRVDPVDDVEPVQEGGAPLAPSPHGDSELLLNDVRSCLNGAGRLGFRRIHMTLEAGQVVLRGSVRTWFEKQLAQHLAMQTPGVTRVVNELIVDSDRVREA
ncbi:MAG TPA: BON domain-containing protein [Caulifigura sp.]|nr:BON domain-containing protein [Caulifigura sp.]